MIKKKKTVLIAEDDAYLADVMQKALLANGLAVKIVHDGAATIKAFAKVRPDLLLLDLLMPTVDGYGVLEYMRKQEIDIPVVIISNISDREEQERCKSAGCKGFLVKSTMDDDAIWPAIKKYLR